MDGSAPDEVSEEDHWYLDLLISRRDGLEGARQQLLETTTKLRTGIVTTAVVVLLAGPLLSRFIYLSSPERLILPLLPLMLLIPAAIIDLLYYRPQLVALEQEVDRLDEELSQRGGDLLGGLDRRHEYPTLALALFYGLPILADLVLSIWWAA